MDIQRPIHPAHADFDPKTVKWYVVVDDLVGGFAVTTVNYPLSSGIYARRWPVFDQEQFEVLCFPVCLADFVREEDARYVVELHNRNLKEKLIPDLWCIITDTHIHDPDGWRNKDALSWDVPITRSEFERRVAKSTTARKGFVDDEA